MRKIWKKVDNIRSVKEAVELESLGVEIMGVSLSVDFQRNSISRNLNSIIQIREVLNKSKLSIKIPLKYDYKDIISLINKIEVDYIQVEGKVLPIDIMKKLKTKGIGIIYSGIKASYDDDPSWIMSPYGNEEGMNADFYQIELLGDIKNSWSFINKESPKYPEELQIIDIIKIGNQFPILLSMDFNKENIHEIINDIPSAKGFCLSITENSNINDVHRFDYNFIVKILSSLSPRSR